MCIYVYICVCTSAYFLIFIAQIFSALQVVFLLGFPLRCVRLAVHSFTVHLVLGSLTSKLHMTAIPMSDCVACVIILCSFLCRSLLNNNMRKAHSAYDAVLHTLFGISMTVIDKLSESKLLQDSYVEYKMSRA